MGFKALTARTVLISMSLSREIMWDSAVFVITRFSEGFMPIGGPEGFESICEKKSEKHRERSVGE